MNFSNLKEWTTQRGSVVELAIDGKIAWKKVVNVPISTLPVGSSVFMNVGGVRTEFLVVNQGVPSASTLYEDTADGTWLLMKNVYKNHAWRTEQNTASYNFSSIHSYLNNDFINLLDSGIANIIKEIAVPYFNQYDNITTVLAKVFILCCYEVGRDIMWRNEGGMLEYFKDNDNEKRIAYLDGNATIWFLRSKQSGSSNNTVFVVTGSGEISNTSYVNSWGVRPALVLPSDTLVDGDFNVIA